LFIPKVVELPLSPGIDLELDDLCGNESLPE
jgi:hypothetical protein